MIKRFCDICKSNEVTEPYKAIMGTNSEATIHLSIEYSDSQLSVYFDDVCTSCFNELYTVVKKLQKR